MYKEYVDAEKEVVQLIYLKSNHHLLTMQVKVPEAVAKQTQKTMLLTN